MTKRQRSLLFLFLALLFVVLAPTVVLYSQGYRIDWQAKRITQTGGLHFKTIPSRVNISIDGKLVKRTDFFFGTALLTNLFPGQYYVEITKKGFQPWHKILEIQKKEVTEAENVLLFPETTDFLGIADSVEQLWMTPSRDAALLQKRNPDKTWSVSLLSFSTLQEKSLFSQQHSKEYLLDIQWSSDAKRILVKKSSGDQLQYEVWGITEGVPCFLTPCTLEFLPADIGNVRFSAISADLVLYTRFLNNSQVLLQTNYRTKEDSPPLGNNIVAFTTKETGVFWISDQGNLWQRDLLLENSSPIQEEIAPFPIAKEQSLKLLPVENAVLLIQKNSLFQLIPKSVTTQEILSSVTSVEISPDQKKVGLANDSELWVYYLAGEQNQPRRTAGEKVFLTRQSRSLANLTWITSHHLLFSIDNTIWVAEIDDRNHLNTAAIAEFPNPQVFWDKEKDILYVLSENVLFVSEKLVK